MTFQRGIHRRADVVHDDRTETILSRHLDSDFVVFPMAERSAAPGQVQELGDRLGFRVPPEVSAHLCGKFPGIYVEVKEAVWPRPKQYDVGPSWSFLYALHTFTAAPESQPWMRLDEAAIAFQRETGLKAAPVLKVVGDADLYCVTEQGRLARFLHEENRLDPVPLGFWDLLDREVAELALRKKRKTTGSER